MVFVISGSGKRVAESYNGDRNKAPLLGIEYDVATPRPTPSPTLSPTSTPTEPPTPSPTLSPTEPPTPQPTQSPTKTPTADPTPEPTQPPTPRPTPSPTLSPTEPPTPQQTQSPTKAPTADPTQDPTQPPWGAVNERFTCCAYQALTKSMPSYCDVFDFANNYLFDYCKNNDYQRYGASNYDMISGTALYIPEGMDENANYIYVDEPTLVKIKIMGKNKARIMRGGIIPLKPGMYQKSQVRGDFARVKDAAKEGIESLLKVKVFYRRPTSKDVLLFSPNTTVDVPLLPGTSHDNLPQTVSEQSSMIEVILDTNGRTLGNVRASPISTSGNKPIKPQ